MKLFSLLCVLSSLLVMSAAQAAPAKAIKVTDPAAAMKALYAKLEKDDFTTELPLSARLNALMALDTKEAKGEVGRLDGDYYINGQDSKVTNVTVTSRDVDNAPGRKIVVVLFKNFDKQMENHFFWEKTKAGWVLDDVRYLDEKDGYTLSLMVKYGWDGPEDLEKKTK
ncbi:MAG: YbjP/YqhG family protein [Alphaproteobacteria bacterium]|nr:YbjP/YqhG family protein [Alphaproteobacteria bacterium]